MLRKKNIQWKWCSAIAMIIASYTPAMAQSQDASTSDEAQDGGGSVLLGDIVVTARRREETAQSVPVSINAFDGKQLQALGVMASRDLATITPGLQWKSLSPFSGNTIFLRGVGNNSVTYTSSPAVGVYLDEAYLNSQPLLGFTTFDVERVEVLKGPQGTLYGRNTTGGAIKYITRKPEIGKPITADVNLDVGNYGLVKIDGGIGASLGEKAAIRVSFSSYDRGGLYRDYVNDNQVTDIEAKAIRANFLLEPSDRLSILVGGTYARSNSQDTFYKRVDNSDPASLSFDQFGTPFYAARCANPGVGTAPGCTSLLQLFGVPDELNTDAYQVQTNLSKSESLERIRSWGAWLTINYDLDFATLTSATSYYSLNLSRPSDVDGSAFNALGLYDTGKPRQFSQELRLTSKGNGPLRWLLGAYYYNEKVEQADILTVPIIASGFATFIDQRTKSYSLFAEATYQLTPTLDLTAGLRWTRDERKVDYASTIFFADGRETFTYGEAIAQGALPGSFVADDRREAWGNLSGRVILSYKPSENVMFYASASRGFKGGEFNSSAATVDTAAYVDPETVDAFEAGFKSDLFDRKLRFNASAFYYRYKKKQETRFDSGFAILSNADAQVKGIEADITASPVTGLTFNAGLSLLDTKYTRFQFCLPDGTDCTGNRLPSAPKVMFNGLVRYEFDILGRTASVQGDTSYTSRRFFDFRNASYISDEAYWLFNARVSYDLSKGLTAAAWVRNISNKRYFQNGLDVSQFGYSLLLAGVPRTYGGSISYRF